MTSAGVLLSLIKRHRAVSLILSGPLRTLTYLSFGGNFDVANHRPGPNRAEP